MWKSPKTPEIAAVCPFGFFVENEKSYPRVFFSSCFSTGKFSFSTETGGKIRTRRRAADQRLELMLVFISLMVSA